MPRRLGRLFDGVTRLVEGYRPDAVAVEELFFNTNVTTAITVGQARGVALLAAYKAGGAKLEVAEYTPPQVKQAITSYGRADKRQVQEMVKALLNLPAIPRPDDAADGLVIAVTHAFSGANARPNRLHCRTAVPANRRTITHSGGAGPPGAGARRPLPNNARTHQEAPP